MSMHLRMNIKHQWPKQVGPAHEVQMDGSANMGHRVPPKEDGFNLEDHFP